MERRICYPGTTQNIADPFHILTCTCGYRVWTLLARIKECPKCGRIMEEKTVVPEERGSVRETGG